MFRKTFEFLKDVRSEFTKVSWPSREELFGSLWVVILISLLVAIFIGVTDLVFTKIISVVLK